MDFYLKIAGLPFHITGWEQPMPESLEDYRCPAEAEAVPVILTEAAKNFERAEAEAAGESFPADEYEVLAAVRQMAKAYLARNRMLIHGAGIAFRGRGFLFTAPSGTGKTTHIRLWKQYLDNDVQIINGDKPVLTFGENITMSGSPWAGKENEQKNETVPLDAVILLKRGTENTMRRVTSDEALEGLYGQIFLINDPESASDILGCMDQLLRKIPVYELQCTMDEDAVRCSFEGLTNLSYARAGSVQNFWFFVDCAYSRAWTVFS